jgi:hypothetical protein
MDAKAEAEVQVTGLMVTNARTGSLTTVSKAGEAPNPACSSRRRDGDFGMGRPGPGAADRSEFLSLCIFLASFAVANQV